MANDREPSVSLVHRAVGRSVFRVRVGNAELIAELSGSTGALNKALEVGTSGALYTYLDHDVECGEREVALAQRSFTEGPDRAPLRRCVVRIQPAEWRFILRQMQVLLAESH